MKDIAKEILALGLSVGGLIGVYFNVDGAALALIAGLFIAADFL